MAQTLSQAFLSSPIKFLTKFAVSMDFSQNLHAGLQRFKVEDQLQNDIVISGAPAGGQDTFPAYFLPYSDNTVWQIRLGSDADIMFTPALTGCSFFVGGKRKNPMISHMNFQDESGGIDQERIDYNAQSLFDHAITGIPSALRKADYVPDGESAQDHRVYVIGIREKRGLASSKKWRMYRMKHDPMQKTVSEPPNCFG
ncbi:hypothetical protein [Aliiruegeria sabulilitoris]|uniref:hypothetical protein n=1 Tax=Aliiruegeria sabulilitoris TaxID=1510458 RepID=UPI00083074E7|nr:hypothetical protein [Aliiruegeria sabulilitoris]NDR57399.1 hypothetical protein [Pseudoruegeria sp. M32A2M]